MKTVLFVPGFREDMSTRKYSNVLDAIRNKGYNVTFVPIQWKRTTIQAWVTELDVEYSKYDAKNTVLAGFSFGALTAFISATKRNPAQLWLFSFSPYFSDDMPHMKKSWLSNIGHRRADAFRVLNFTELSKYIKCPTLIIAGEVEAKKYPILGRRSKIAHKAIDSSKLVWVSDTDHDVTDARYVAAVKEAI